MPVFPEDKFVEAVKEVVKANIDYVPPYGSGATLYIRPYMFGSNPVIGVKPADEYQFRIFVTPVGPYFKGGAKPITIRVTDLDRAAPRGTGHIKAGLNYAMSLYNIVDAHENGFDENLYVDPATRTKVEETGGANCLFVDKNGTVVVPKSPSILPSITRRSLVTVAKDYLGLNVEEREVYLSELSDFAEMGLCGTAAVISPVGKVYDHGKEICFPSGMDEMEDRYPCPILEEWYIFRQETIGDDADDDDADVEEIAFPINVDQRLAFCHLDLLRHASCRQILFVIMAIHQVKNGKKDDHIHQKDRRQLECPCKGYASLESHEKRRITERRKTPAHIRHEENQENHDVRNMPAPCIDADQRTDEQHRSSCRTDPARHKRPDKKDQRIRLRCAR